MSCIAGVIRIILNYITIMPLIVINAEDYVTIKPLYSNTSLIRPSDGIQSPYLSMVIVTP